MPQNDWTIYYNPKCGTCRKTLEILNKRGVQPRVVEYLKTPPTLPELEAIAAILSGPFMEMIREKEDIFSKLKLGDGKKSTKDLLRAIVEHPILLQRPIVVHGQQAVVARPPENVNVLFD